MTRDKAKEILVDAHRLEAQALAVLQARSSLESASAHLQGALFPSTPLSGALEQAVSNLDDTLESLSPRRIRSLARDRREEVLGAHQHENPDWDYQGLYDSAETQEERRAVRSFAREYGVELSS